MNTTGRESRPPRSALSYIIQTLLVAAAAPNHRVIKHTAANAEWPRCVSRPALHCMWPQTSARYARRMRQRVYISLLKGSCNVERYTITDRFVVQISAKAFARRICGLILRQMCGMRWLIVFCERYISIKIYLFPSVYRTSLIIRKVCICTLWNIDLE